jgi:CDP-ribitol ribitolphosphotransferase
MQLNEHTKVWVDRLAIRRNVMTLGVIVKDTSGRPEQTELKLAVEFINSDETRILPLPISATSLDENGYYTGYAVLDYEMDVLFKNKDLNEFQVNVQIYDGTTYQDITVPDETFSQLKDENEYQCTVENERIMIRRKQPVHTWNNWFLSLLSGIYRLVEILIGIVLIPLFLIDGFYLTYMDKERWGEEKTFGGRHLKRMILFAKWRFSSFCRWSATIAKIKRTLLNIFIAIFSPFCKKRYILFVSTRRNDLTGNVAFVNEVLQERNEKVLFWLEASKTKYIKIRSLVDLAYKIARSKVIVVDDFTSVLNDSWGLKNRTYIQLWHACGAFKTFGFSRFGKDGGPHQTSRNHRNYNYAIVSSAEIRRFYAEGFGIDIKNVLPLGVPRTDIFFQESYKESIRKQLYDTYPMLQGKKVVLFAPTFRGNGVATAYFPFEMFKVEEFVRQLGDEYIVIVKHHPFVKEPHPIPETVKDQVLDLSKESEINDLLFITDILITDYSSVIFEASLLDIPMLFFAFDLEEYVVTRDFYYPFKNFVPGKIVRTQDAILESIQKEDFEQEKIETFKHRFFDDFDGKSSERVADFIVSKLNS